MNYNWKMIDGYPLEKRLRVFGTFVCGGGSTMGYKLAGFDHLGGVEIDRKMAEIYRRNHAPKHFYEEDIRDFNCRTDLPAELYDLDILDGSPPCSSFSVAGKREQNWGKAKSFREGQKKQVLDELVFVYCDTIAKLRPKVAILENVRGLVMGNAKPYAKKIWETLDRAGYDVQLFLLNAATMGVPQSRERVFFIARRKDLQFPKLQLHFNERPVRFGEVRDQEAAADRKLWPSIEMRLPFVIEGETSLSHADMRFRDKTVRNAFFNTNIFYDTDVARTTTANGTAVVWEGKRWANATEIKRMFSFPQDFDFAGKDANYVCGMSVPPLMIARIAEQIQKQWFPI